MSGGVGGRYRLVDGGNARVDLSIAALLERTDSRRADPTGDDVTSTGRWSARFRVRRTFSDERRTFDLVSYYRPRMGAMDDCTIELATGLQYALTSIG